MVQPMRAALYARVSKKDQVEGYSLDAQKRSFRALVKGKDWTAHREYIEGGKSAHTDDINKRPVFKEAMEDAMSGHYDVLVVHKIDRFSRDVRLTLEYFWKLGKAGVGFVSIENQMDYTTPSGKFMLVMQGGLAELYSDNLSQEVKKGLAERKAQGFHLGPMPFGATTGEDGVAIPDPRNYAGLKLAFELGAEGHTDRQIAQELNLRDYRTVGTRGGKPFSTTTVQGILTNKFYRGYLKEDTGDWVRGRHESFISEELWSAAQETRKRNRTSTHSKCGTAKRVWSLTGLTHCWECKGRIHAQNIYKGTPRLGCYTRQKGHGCNHKSGGLKVYEDQLVKYLEAFHIPDDYQKRMLAARQELQEAFPDAEKQRGNLERQLARLRDLYVLGDYTLEEYQTRKKQAERKLETFESGTANEKEMESLAVFLSDISIA